MGMLVEASSKTNYWLVFRERSTVMKKLFIFSTVTAGLFCSPAAAQETRFLDTTEYRFDDDVVLGDLVRPDDADIVVRRRGKERSLIKVRTHFIPEMLKSVEDL